jgi:arylsulfatase A-like enzyme
MFPGPLDRHPIRNSFRRRARGDRDGGNLLEVCRRANVIVPGRPRRSQGEKENAVVADLPNQMRFISLLLLSAWRGLVAGLLEVATIVVRKSLFDPDHLSRMSCHFVWLVPLSNVAVFLTLGLLGCGVTLVWPRRGRWLFTRVLGALGLLPFLLVAFPRIYSLAWLVAALGMAARLVPLVEHRSRGFRRFVLASLPAAVAIVAILGGSLWVGDRLKQLHENGRPLPPPGSPNVLLIVMDTVAASHLSLHVYDRPTSTTLVELAGRAIRFDSARATSSWTLPSHASMFTGRWFHELSVGWFTPLDQAPPTLAEFLGDRGYATAGFVANTGYCAADSGLSRGFTQYQDFIFPELTALKTAVLVSRALMRMHAIVFFSEDWLESAGLLPHVERLMWSLDGDRKGAAAVNCELLDWLSRRARPERPFFAFLNYNDAHYPYELPPGRLHRFGAEPSDSYQRFLIQQWGWLDKKTLSPVGVAFAADAYDDCIADLDEQLGKLVDLLDRSGVLERTWLIISSDHGESFGEHDSLFCHGVSLYDTELHVPLLIIPPAGSATGQAVKEPVSLRDLATTIVDVVGQQAGSPFPGVSLARFWKQPRREAPIEPAPALPALAEVVPYDWKKRDFWGLPQERFPLGAVKGGEWSYMRREADGREELFHLSEDAEEQRNLAGDPSARATLEQMRALLHRMTGGPLLPERFSR